MNVSETIKTRTSLRVYDDRMIADSDLDQILEAAFLAPTAGNQQLYSIIVIKSQETKDKLSKSCDNQPFIAKAPVLLLFLADQQKWFDYYRSKGCMEFAAREEGLSWEEPNESDLLLSIEDTMIAAQNNNTFCLLISFQVIFVFGSFTFCLDFVLSIDMTSLLF